MDEKTKSDIVDALRSAGRALRLAEKALRTTGTDSPSQSPPEATTQKVSAPESALEKYLVDEAESRKTKEETDPASFSPIVAEHGSKLIEYAFDRRLYRVSPEASGTVKPESTVSRTVFERMVKLLQGIQVDVFAIFEPFSLKPDIKNTSDVESETDLVIMQYETPGSIEHDVDAAKLLSLVESARETPGSIERVVSRLKSRGVEWDPFLNGDVNPRLIITGVQARWSACIDLHRVADSVTDLLSAIDVDMEKTQSPWWVAAQSAMSVPTAVLPIIRGGQTHLLVKRDDANAVEDWAAELSHWYEDQPLIIRDVSKEDILEQNTGDAMANQNVTATAKNPASHSVEKVGDKWRVRSSKSGLWPAKYDTEDKAKGALAAYHIKKKTSASRVVQATDEVAPTEDAVVSDDMEMEDEVVEELSEEASTATGEEPPPPMTLETMLTALDEGSSLTAEMLPLLGMTSEHLEKFEALPEENKASFLEVVKTRIREALAPPPEEEAPPAPEAPAAEAPPEAPAPVEAKTVKAAESVENAVENKGYLKKINKLIKMGLLTATELHGAVMEALRMANVSPVVADAAADKVREALFLTEEEAAEVQAAKVIDAGDVIDFHEKLSQKRKEKAQKFVDNAMETMSQDPGFQPSKKEVAEQKMAEMAAGPPAFKVKDMVTYTASDGGVPADWIGKILSYESHPEWDEGGSGHFYNVKWRTPKNESYEGIYHQDDLKKV